MSEYASRQGTISLLNIFLIMEKNINTLPFDDLTPFSLLPVEVVQVMLETLSQDDIEIVRSTCKKFYNICHDNLFWIRKIHSLSQVADGCDLIFLISIAFALQIFAFGSVGTTWIELFIYFLTQFFSLSPLLHSC